MRVVVTGATGTIGRAVVRALLDRDDEVVALSRDARRAREVLGDDVDVIPWRDPKSQPAPSEAFEDAGGVINLLGEPLAQRWNETAKREIRDSRVVGTRNLVEGMASAGPRLRALVSQSATGYYGAHGDEPVDESVPAGDDYLASVVVEWEAAGGRADELGMRVVTSRTGVVLSPSGGALENMLP